MAELSLHRDLALIGDADVDGLVDLLIDRTDHLEGFLKLIVILVVFLHVLQHIPTNKIRIATNLFTVYSIAKRNYCSKIL